MNKIRRCAIRKVAGMILLCLSAAASVSAQTVDIKVNGADDSITLPQTAGLSVTIALLPEDREFEPADWWIAISIPPAISIYLDISGGFPVWKQGLAVTYQGPLVQIPAVEVLNISSLPTGTYHFCFGVDIPMNGTLSATEALYFDFVTVNITETQRSYPVVDTGQATCYDDSEAIPCPAPNENFYGQDAQYIRNAPSYKLAADGLTVHDTLTGLTWTQSPDLDGDGDIDVDDKLTFAIAQSYSDTLNVQSYGGYSDWRLPTIKELYSLMDFRGTDPVGMAATGSTPFIDTNYFAFAYGDTSAGERSIDAQFWSANAYVAKVFGDQSAAFGLNLADGRIKGYPTDAATGKKNFVYFVRGNTVYGLNDFSDNGDGTVSDHATGLMWAKDDSGAGMTWEDALAWVQQKNNQNYLGRKDWRLPSAKEMQSIVDYSLAPAATGTAAIDPVLNISGITNEAGQPDFPWFWTSTTHVRSDGSGTAGAYICFGRALGYMNGSWLDVHGAGAQRSDRKKDDFSGYTYVPFGYYFAMSPQGDAVRIFNFVRLVRSADD